MATPFSEYTAIPSKWDDEADIVIIGSGGAAAASAISAHEGGIRKILILEKAPFSGGASASSGGAMAASHSKLHLQGKIGIKDSEKLHYEDTIKGGNYKGNPELAKKLCYEAPNTINWMVDLGFEFKNHLMHLGGHSVPRAYNFVGAGVGMMRTARNLLKKREIPILLEHRVVDLLRDAPRKGRIKGVKVNYQGKKIMIKAKKAVIMCAGGFTANLTMRMKHDSTLNEKLGNTSSKYVTGDGIVMGKSIMADTGGMDYIQILPRTNVNGKLDKVGIETFWKIGQGAIDVNKQGKRFVNSLAKREVEASFILNQEKPVFVIYDEQIKSMASALTDEQYRKATQRGRIIKGNTIEEMARKAGINCDTLVTTIAEYNNYVDAGEDPEFNRPVLEAKIEKAPFYAIPSWTAVHYTMGGLLINTKSQVIDIWGNIIPGFYAAGEVTGGIHGTCRLGSNALAEIWTFGRIAGQMALAEEPWA
jgi:urocanate reductase